MGCVRSETRRQELYRDDPTSPRVQTKKQNLVTVTIHLFPNSKTSLQVASCRSVLDLKKIILADEKNGLPIEIMILLFDSKPLIDSSLVSQICSSRAFNLVQKRAEIWQISDIRSDRNKQDQIFSQRGAALMSCNHYISRTAMKEAIKYQIQVQNKLKINCPYLNVSGDVCNVEWNLSKSFSIAGLTINEINIMNEKLSINRIKKQCKECPHCGEFVTNQGISSKKLKCPKCNGSEFCFSCRQKWEWGSGQICESDICVFIRKKIAQAPWTRAFMMYKKSNKSEKFPVKVPNIRACPRCSQLIQNYQNCKHTPCYCTKDKEYSFCYVCLSLSPERGRNWACGQPFQYCGNVASNQQINIRIKKSDFS